MNPASNSRLLAPATDRLYGPERVFGPARLYGPARYLGPVNN